MFTGKNRVDATSRDRMGEPVFGENQFRETGSRTVTSPRLAATVARPHPFEASPGTVLGSLSHEGIDRRHDPTGEAT